MALPHSSYRRSHPYSDENVVLERLAPLVLVGGKGGVGKSYVSRRIARALQTRQTGGRTVLVRFDNDAMVDSTEPSRGPDAGIDLRVLNPAAALRDQAARIIGSPRLARLVFDNSAIRSALDLVPGIHEVALLLAVEQLCDRYDRVIVDLPATGHGGSWLRAPDTLLSVVDGGRAQSITAQLAGRLQDPHSTSFVLVTTTEPFVLLEAQQLSTSLKRDASIPTAAIVVNRVPPSIDGATRRATWRLASSDHPAAADAALLARALSEQAIATTRSGRALASFDASIPILAYSVDEPGRTSTSKAA